MNNTINELPNGDFVVTQELTELEKAILSLSKTKQSTNMSVVLDAARDMRDLAEARRTATSGQMSLSNKMRGCVQNGKRDFAHTTMDGEPFHFNHGAIGEGLEQADLDAEFIASACNIAAKWGV